MPCDWGGAARGLIYAVMGNYLFMEFVVAIYGGGTDSPRLVLCSLSIFLCLAVEAVNYFL